MFYRDELIANGVFLVDNGGAEVVLDASVIIVAAVFPSHTLRWLVGRGARRGEKRFLLSPRSRNLALSGRPQA